MIDLTKLCFSTLLIVLAVIIVLPIHKWNLPFSYYFDESFKAESSVWCQKISHNINQCRFKNICYDSHLKTFLFFLGKETIIKGVEHYTELHKIQLSSVNFHNHFYANISMIDIDDYEIKKEIIVESKALLFSRFKPNNIMHTIHDDLFPVFLTLESVCLGEIKCIEEYSLVIHDHHPTGPFLNLYKLFSKKGVILLNNLTSGSNNLLCFNKILTGLVQDSIFYQYGFKKPHGPVKPLINQNDISRFTSFIKEKFQIHNAKNTTSEIIIFSRQKNRKILNIDEVKQMIITTLQEINRKCDVKVIALDLYSNRTTSLIKLVSQAEVLIGMHGAEMIFSLFMKSKSVVFELFPFGIDSEIVSFIKPVSDINGSHLMYFPWKNADKTKSVTHPDAHPSFGGIGHLDKITQEKIKHTKKVPPVKCCNNPLFLYHMYQDTFVSVEFKQFFLESISKFYSYQKNTDSESNTKKWFYPYTVSNVSCGFQMSKKLLRVDWLPPFNIKNINHLKYSLYLKDQTSNFEWEILTDRLSVELEITETVKTGAKFQVWIAVDDGKSKSPDLYVECYYI